MCVNSEGSGETARMPRLTWAFAGRLCDKYHNLMSWLIVPYIKEITVNKDIFGKEFWKIKKIKLGTKNTKVLVLEVFWALYTSGNL